MSFIRRGRMMIDELGKFYTSIANNVFRDPRLSSVAKSALGLISTHQNGYNITAESLCAKLNPDGIGLKEGLSTIKKALRELEEYGYLVRVRLRDEDGMLAGTCYEITDMPEGVEFLLPPPYNQSEPEVENPAVTLQPQVKEARLPRSEPTVTSPPLVSPPLVRQPVIKKNKEEKNKNSPPPTEGESRAHASAPERARANITSTEETQPLENDLFSEFDQEPQEENPSSDALDDSPKITKIPTLDEEKRPSVDTEVPSIDEPRQRRALARDLADRWWQHCDLQGKPFPRSEPGAKFPKIAEFGTMISKILLSYSEQETWAALVAILDTRHNAYPSRPELERAMNAERARLARPTSSSPTWPAPSADVDVLDPETADLVNRAVTWWREDHYLPTSSEGRFRGMLADALGQGVTPKQVADALRACDKADPPPWEFAAAVTKVRQGLDSRQARQAAGLAPKLSQAEERDKRREEDRQARKAYFAKLKAEAGLSDPRNDEPVITGTIIQGEVS